MKIVGTPYTVYLGRNLYNTFMDAYTLVDSPTRKAMEGMLKTWKEPVPGSIDTRPVFSSDVTRAIENALIKARTAAIQHQQSQARQQQQSLSPYVATPHAAGLWRSTPTPPQKFVQHQVASNLPSFGSQQSSGQTPTVGCVISLYIGIGSNKINRCQYTPLRYKCLQPYNKTCRKLDLCHKVSLHQTISKICLKMSKT